MLKIWGRANSQNVQKVLWCCTELGVEFERIDWAGDFGGNDDPAYRRLNPHGKVPTIEDGSQVVWESNTIQRYLCASRGNTDLYPASPAGRSRIERWMDWQLSSLNPPMVALLLGYYRTPAEKRNAAQLEAARKQAIAQWQVVEGELATRPFLAGDQFTIADIGCGILAYRWYAYPVERPSLPNLAAWLARLSERPGFAKYVDQPVS